MLYWLGKHPSQPLYTISRTNTHSDGRPTVGPTPKRHARAPRLSRPECPLSRKLSRCACQARREGEKWIQSCLQPCS